MAAIRGSHTHGGFRVAALLIVAVVAASAVLAGCGGSKHKAASTSSPPTAGSGSGADAATIAAVKTAFTTFFDGTASVDARLSYLQNAPTFEQELAAQANSPLIKQTNAVVSSVKLTSATVATVVYTVSLAKTPVLQNQNGTAVLISGGWKVSASTFCALLALEGPQPPACTQAAVTTLPS